MLRTAFSFARDAYWYLTFNYGQFRGVYESLHEAEAAVPRGKKVGYDHEDLARDYQAKLSLRLESFEYPVLFHLGRIIGECHTILDFGGNIGTHYLR